MKPDRRNREKASAVADYSTWTIKNQELFGRLKPLLHRTRLGGALHFDHAFTCGTATALINLVRRLSPSLSLGG